MNFVKFLRTLFLQNTSSRPFLNIRRFYEFGLKSKAFAGIKFQGFTINRVENYYRGTGLYITLKIQMFRWSHLSQFLKVVAFENTPANKDMFKVYDTRTTSVNVTWVSFD